MDALTRGMHCHAPMNTSMFDAVAYVAAGQPTTAHVRLRLCQRNEVKRLLKVGTPPPIA
jgi:hypothetical protein